MDRLSAVALVTLLATTACGSEREPSPQTSPQPTGRFEAVRHGKGHSLAELCDRAPQPAAPFAWPELSSSAPQPSAGGAKYYRWVNVWATWCSPCIKELPRLANTLAEWKRQGRAVTLTLLSVDADPAAAQRFIQERPGLPETLQIKPDSGHVNSWLSAQGVSAGAAIPVHFILDAQDRLVCARSGEISEDDLDRFRRALFP